MSLRANKAVLPLKDKRWRIVNGTVRRLPSAAQFS